MRGSQDTGENQTGPYNDSQEHKESGQHSLENHFFYLTVKENQIEAASRKANEGGINSSTANGSLSSLT